MGSDPRQATRRRNDPKEVTTMKLVLMVAIDQQNLYFVRMLRPAGKDGSQTQETQFNKYQKLGGGWMAPEVIFMVDGKVMTTEKYSELRSDVKLDPRLFDPQFWTTVHWKE